MCSTTDCTGRGELEADFPGAVMAETVGIRCDRCGGLWRHVEDGVSCLSCGRHHAIVEVLQGLAARGVTDYGERWPSVRINPGSAKGTR